MSPKIVKNLHWTNKKLHGKGEPYRFSGLRDNWIDHIFLWQENKTNEISQEFFLKTSLSSLRSVIRLVQNVEEFCKTVLKG